MQNNLMVFSIFLIFSGAAILSTLALATRQSLLVAYMAIGIVLGPAGLAWIANPLLIEQISNIGIIFLLFLLGVHMHPKKLFKLLTETAWVCIVSSLLIGAFCFGFAMLFGFDKINSLIIAISLIFSSTIIGLKLLPTKIIAHQRVGDLIISILLMQDVFAIIVLLFLQGADDRNLSWHDLSEILIGFPSLIIAAFLSSRLIIYPLFKRFAHTSEYLFIVAIAWCLSFAELSQSIGLSEEIGAFIAGISLAANQSTFHLAETLKPLRDFFLVLFFFSIGASLEIKEVQLILLPALLLAIGLTIIKPLIFGFLLRKSQEKSAVAYEVGLRLGQASEFSLLVSALASQTFLITEEADLLIRTTTIFTFITSSYLTALFCFTPFSNPIFSFSKLFLFNKNSEKIRD